MNEPRNNKTTLTGQVREEPVFTELRSGLNSLRFNLETNEMVVRANGEQSNDHQSHVIVCWGQMALLHKNNIKKGDTITVVGRIQYRSYKNSNNQTIYLTEIIAHSLTHR